MNRDSTSEQLKSEQLNLEPLNSEQRDSTQDANDDVVMVAADKQSAGEAGPTVYVTNVQKEDAPTKATLFRHPTEKVVGGVCGGLADYFGWDPALMRILWVILTLMTGGGGFIAYLALWMLLPVGTISGGQQKPATVELSDRNMSVAAILLIGLGGTWLLVNIGVLPWLWGGFWAVMRTLFWPALLIGAGFVLLRGYTRKDWGRFNFEKTADQVKGQVKGQFGNQFSGKMPNRDEFKGNFNTARQRIPLKRSQTDRVFMGVCGGIGKKLGIDANLVRLIWGALSIGSIGMGVIAYVIVGLLLPEEEPVEVVSFK